ncbi:MAG: GHKL domain-containing protein [Ruminococcus sp.]|nr:GHKL domain-containing protein [Ruminococcus sp.]
MFRKVQLKFFGIIIAILIAIFIGVLSSINIIMDLMMERQTNIVLHQVAVGVDFDEKTKSFTFTNPEKDKEPSKKGSKPAGTKKTTTTQPSERQTEAVPPTAKPTETNPPVVHTNPQAVQTQPPVRTEAVGIPKTETIQTKPTEPPQTSPPTAPHTTPPPPETKPPQTTYPPFNWEGMQPPENWGYPPFNWEEYWKFWDEWNKNNGGQMPFAQSYTGSGGVITPLSNDSFIPPIEGYTIITLTEKTTVTTEKNTKASNLKENTEPVPKSLGSIEFFVIMADRNGRYIASANNDALTKEEAQKYINNIMAVNDNSGMTGNISFCAEKKPNGTLMVLTDRTSELDMMRKLKRTTLIVGIISIILISAAAYFLSGIIVKPLKETFEKQKQFISDASHELKTPLTVISANADVLEGEIGNNKWLNYIQDQADRMNVLVNDLLSLSRLENSSRDFITSYFDLSRAITNASLPFECQAFESRKNFVLNIEEGIRINGSEQHIKQMAGIFIDNALKYSKDGGTVRVSLSRDDNKAILAVYNTGSGVREEDVDKLFERFYRSDESRARTTGGYGLGLAIAKSIIDKHKFKVQVENQEGKSICFVVTMQ